MRAAAAALRRCSRPLCSAAGPPRWAATSAQSSQGINPDGEQNGKEPGTADAGGGGNSNDESCLRALRSSIREGKLNSVVECLSADEVRALGVAALSNHFGKDVDKEFEEADLDKSGQICKAEFRRYVSEVVPEHHSSDASRPTNRQLVLFALNSSLPFVVFGALDNSIMIVGGDVVDELIGSTMQLSTLACAAVANTFADVLGISIGNSVEALTAKLGLPPANLTHAQSRLPLVRRLGLAAGSGGILLGCVLGMAPLLVIDAEKHGKE